MLHEASIITKAGVPIWVRSAGPSIVSGILTGAMLGALTMFSSEVTGKSLKSVEMSDGYKLHIHPFNNGQLNLAIIADSDILMDPEILDIIKMLSRDIKTIIDQDLVELEDNATLSALLSDNIDRLDRWFTSQVFNQEEKHKSRSKNVVKISGKITHLRSQFSREQLSVLIVDNYFNTMFMEPSNHADEEFLDNLREHLRGWIGVSSHSKPLLPEMLFFKEICMGIKSIKNVYIMCGIPWEGAIGDIKIISKVKSWLSQLSRRI